MTKGSFQITKANVSLNEFVSQYCNISSRFYSILFFQDQLLIRTDYNICEFGFGFYSMNTEQSVFQYKEVKDIGSPLCMVQNSFFLLKKIQEEANFTNIIPDSKYPTFRHLINQYIDSTTSRIPISINKFIFQQIYHNYSTETYKQLSVKRLPLPSILLKGFYS